MVWVWGPWLRGSPVLNKGRAPEAAGRVLESGRSELNSEVDLTSRAAASFPGLAVQTAMRALGNRLPNQKWHASMKRQSLAVRA